LGIAAVTLAIASIGASSALANYGTPMTAEESKAAAALVNRFKLSEFTKGWRHAIEGDDKGDGGAHGYELAKDLVDRVLYGEATKEDLKAVEAKGYYAIKTEQVLEMIRIGKDLPSATFYWNRGAIVVVFNSQAVAEEIDQKERDGRYKQGVPKRVAELRETIRKNRGIIGVNWDRQLQRVTYECNVKVVFTAKRLPESLLTNANLKIWFNSAYPLGGSRLDHIDRPQGDYKAVLADFPSLSSTGESATVVQEDDKNNASKPDTSSEVNVKQETDLKPETAKQEEVVKPEGKPSAVSKMTVTPSSQTAAKGPAAGRAVSFSAESKPFVPKPQPTAYQAALGGVQPNPPAFGVPMKAPVTYNYAPIKYVEGTRAPVRTFPAVNVIDAAYPYPEYPLIQRPQHPPLPIGGSVVIPGPNDTYVFVTRNPTGYHYQPLVDNEFETGGPQHI
jgi:hypothetical protein